MSRLKERTLNKAYQRRALREGTLLLEADQQTIQAIQKALETLDGITPDGAKMFDQAIKNAKLELGKYLQGGIKQTFKNIFSDPVAKASTLANAIRTGLSQLPTIARLYLPPGTERETQKSIWEMVPPENQKDLLATFTKSFKTDLMKGGLGGALDLLKGSGLPYINNLSAAVQELLQNVNPQGGFRLGQQAATQKEPPIQTATDDASAQTPKQTQPQQAATAGTAAATATTPSQETGKTGQSIETEPATVPSGTNTGKRLNMKNDAAKIQQLANFASRRSGVDMATAQKVINSLVGLNAVMDIPLPQPAVKKPPARPVAPTALQVPAEQP